MRLVADDGAAGRGLLAGTDFVNCSAVTPDGQTIVAGGDDGAVHLWTGADLRQQTLSGMAGQTAARARQAAPSPAR